MSIEHLRDHCHFVISVYGHVSRCRIHFKFGIGWRLYHPNLDAPVVLIVGAPEEKQASVRITLPACKTYIA